jgi:hypothetical protein
LQKELESLHSEKSHLKWKLMKFLKTSFEQKLWKVK